MNDYTTYMTDKSITQSDWLSFLHELHNLVRNSKGIKLTGLPALNEISNFLMLYFIEKMGIIEKKKLPVEWKFSSLYNEYLTEDKLKWDDKQHDIEKKNSYQLWQRVYNVNNEKNPCILMQMVDNEDLQKYILSDVHRMSAYVSKPLVHETIRDVFIKIYNKFKDMKIDYKFFDCFGSAYEQFKTDAVSNTGKNTGQHFTPVSIKEFIVTELKPKYNDIYYEPCAGSGGFIHTMCSHILENDDNKEHYEKFKKNIYANECNPEIIKPLMINMLLHNIDVENIRERDSLSTQNAKDMKEKVNIIATNYPFGMKTEIKADSYEKNYWDSLKTGKNIVKDSSAQFLVHICHSLKNGGRAGIVTDRGIFNNGSDGKKQSWQTNFRKWFLENNNVYKIVYLPSGIFDYITFATAIMFFKKGEKTVKIDFYDGKFKDVKNKRGLIVDEKPNKILIMQEIIKNKYCMKVELDEQKVISKTNSNECLKIGEISELERRKIISDATYKLFEHDAKATFKSMLEKCTREGLCEETKLGDIIKINIGGTPDTKNEEYWKEGTNLWVTISELNNNIITNTERKITQKGIENSSVKLIKKDSTMISFKLSIGKWGVSGQDMYCNEAILFFKTENENTDKYIRYYFNYECYKNADTNLMKSGNMGGGSFNKKTLELLPIKLPTLEKQKEIIEKIEEINKNMKIFDAYSKMLQEQINLIFQMLNYEGISLENKDNFFLFF